MDLTNRVAVVTGGARDIGKSIARKLAANGAKVIINYYQSEQKAKETAEQIIRDGGIVSICKGDMTKQEDVHKLVEYTSKMYGPGIDILVNNCGGILGRKKIEEMDEDFFDRVIDLNFKSVFLVTHAFLKTFKPGASIINISSLSARDGGGFGASLYGASKGAVTTFSRGLAKELGPKGIRVNAVCPGLIATTFHDIFTPDEVRQKTAAMTPLRREGTADEVADLVVFLASDKSSFITGANYDINGGTVFS
jgi:3-oxoacyl-[acyl-carrier protein] reductase